MGCAACDYDHSAHEQSSLAKKLHLSLLLERDMKTIIQSKKIGSRSKSAAVLQLSIIIVYRKTGQKVKLVFHRPAMNEGLQIGV
jgi:hypothetical protein